MNWGRYITTGDINDRHQVRYRIDDWSPVTAAWRVSTNYESTGLWRGQGFPFLRALRGAEDLLVATVPHGDREIQANFHVAGIDAALARLAERCSWVF